MSFDYASAIQYVIFRTAKSKASHHSRSRSRSRSRSKSKSRSKKHGSDISVDVNIRMPGVRCSGKAMKQTRSDPTLVSSSSTLADSVVSEATTVLKAKTPRKGRSRIPVSGSRSAQKRRSKVERPPDDISLEREESRLTWENTDDDEQQTQEEHPVEREESRMTWQDSDDDEITFSSAVTSATSLASSAPEEMVFKKAFTTKTPTRSRRNISQRDISPLSSVPSNESIEISYATPVAPASKRPKTPARSTKRKSPARRSVSQDSMHDVSQQASFSTPDNKLDRSMNKSTRRPMRAASDENLASAKAAKVLGIQRRDTPRKAVKILGKTTPTSKPIKRIKTPGRLTPARQSSQPEDEIRYSTRKRRASSTQFQELSPYKRPRRPRNPPKPSWWETWCTIL